MALLATTAEPEETTAVELAWTDEAGAVVAEVGATAAAVAAQAQTAVAEALEFPRSACSEPGRITRRATHCTANPV